MATPDKVLETTVIAAQPGWDVVEPLIEEDGGVKELSYSPVIAWVIERRLFEGEQYVAVLPVNVEGDQADAALRTPRGKVMFPMDREWDTEAAAIKYFDELEREKRLKMREFRGNVGAIG